MTALAPEPADRAIARILAGGREARIDATAANWGAPGPFEVPFDGCDHVPAVGDRVFIYAPEGAESPAIVTAVDAEKRVVRLGFLPWQSLRETG